MERTKHSDIPEPKKIKLRHRNVAHLWADKQVIRFFRKNFDKKNYKNLRMVYFALCEIDSDFGEKKKIKSLGKTIATYSGCSKRIVIKYMKILEDLHLVNRIQIRDSEGNYKGRAIELYKFDKDYHENMLIPHQRDLTLVRNRAAFKNNIDKSILSDFKNDKSTSAHSAEWKSDPTVRSLAKMFCDLFLKPVHGMTKATGSTWWSTIASIHALLYEDGRTPEEVAETIEWISKHHGREYVPEIPTAAKFRHKFNNLRLAMKRTRSRDDDDDEPNAWWKDDDNDDEDEEDQYAWWK